jgi:hypothetical protein
LTNLKAKGTIQNLMWLSMRRIVSRSVTGNETMKELGIVLDFKARTITIDEIMLPIRNINLLQGASTLCTLKLIYSLAMEPKSTLDATKCVIRYQMPNTTKQISSQSSEKLQASKERQTLKEVTVPSHEI